MILSAQPVQPVRPVWPALAWSSAALLGLAVPLVALLYLAEQAETGASITALPVLFALAVMSAAMLAASTSGRFMAGLGAGLGAAFVLGLLAYALGVALNLDFLGMSVAASLASLSFAARGVLFACSARGRGWWVALGVIAGEAAVVLTSLTQPGLWPAWVLALLPAQWASMAIAATLDGKAAIPALIALTGTAAATLLVVRLWPVRWTYGIMFSVWLGLSALVYQSA